MLHLCSLPMTKRFHCMKLVISIIVKNSLLTNKLCYPRIKKKSMFCETSDQYLVANITTCLSDSCTLWIYLECLVSSRGLKIDVLLTNLCYPRIQLTRCPLNKTIYGINWGSFVIQWSSDGIASTDEHLSVFYNYFNQDIHSIAQICVLPTNASDS